MPIQSIKIDAVWKKAVLAICGAAFAFAGWQFAKWGLASSAASRAGDVDVALYLTGLAPADPQTHYAAAVFLEKSFDPKDIEKALQELETATAVSPNNYLLWLELGRARERSGDAEGAERALRQALALAPNYSRVQWALGNALLRQGRTEDAFAEIRKAVVGDPALADSAATTAWLFFDGDINAIRKAMDGSARFESSLAALLMREKRFDEALEIWNKIPADEKKTFHKATGSLLAAKLLEGKRFRSAVQVTNEIGAVDGLQPEKINNGGFESAVKSEGAGPFEWQIAPGLHPQIALSGGQKHGGSNSLYLIFNATDAKEFRTVSQTVAVEPGATYRLEVSYRSDLKTAAVFKWQILDAADGKLIASTEGNAPRAEWTPLHAEFKVPAESDGITIRLVREGCGQVCNISGNLWFDDLSLQRLK